MHSTPASGPPASGSPAPAPGALTSPSPRRARRDLLPLGLLLPSLVLVAGILGYPLLSGLSQSLRDGTLLRPGSFVGLENYRDLLARPEFYRALSFTALFTAVSVVGSYLLGLGLALLLNLNVPGRGVFRVSLLLPWILPSVVSIICWRWMISDEQGLVNVVRGWFGGAPIYFLSSEHWAVVSVFVVKVWRSFPFMLISLLAALQTVDRTLYEAAQIDGASRWQTFRFISWPHLTGISVVLWILMAIWTVNDFDTIWLLTGGGPSDATQSLITLAFNDTFTRGNVGQGAAGAVVMLVLLLGLASLLLRRPRREA